MMLVSGHQPQNYYFIHSLLIKTRDGSSIILVGEVGFLVGMTRSIMDVYVARQPIFDINNEVFAYELLYRNNEKNFFDGSVTSNVATSLLLMNSYYTFGIDKLVDQGKAFINFDKHLIDAEIPHILDKTKVVVELLEDIIPDEGFMRAVRKLKNEGYTIAVDDFVEGFEYMEMVELADIIKVDFFENTDEQISSIAKQWSRSDKMLLAEKVETQEIYEWAKGLGYQLFQGYYFSKPSMVSGKKINDSTFQYVQIIDELNKEEPNYKTISSIIETDANLTYKLLKLVNHNYTASNKINSIQHGLSILGIKAFEKWVSLAMVQDLSVNKPQETIKVSMTRAKFMELVAENSSLKSKSNEMMLVGILSVIDGLLDKEMSEALEELPLADTIKSALLFEDGPYLDSYMMVLSFEKGDFEMAASCSEKLGISSDEVAGYYYQSIEWAEFMFDVMKEF